MAEARATFDIGTTGARYPVYRLRRQRRGRPNDKTQRLTWNLRSAKRLSLTTNTFQLIYRSALGCRAVRLLGADGFQCTALDITDDASHQFDDVRPV
ncbi:hypothetical protein MRX96_011128 [Rhipicephalus microplus]